MTMLYGEPINVRVGYLHMPLLRPESRLSLHTLSLHSHLMGRPLHLTRRGHLGVHVHRRDIDTIRHVHRNAKVLNVQGNLKGVSRAAGDVGSRPRSALKIVDVPVWEMGSGRVSL